jgi:two-component system, LytTR family, response regulator LytT
MRIVIVEDEKLTAQNLAETIMLVNPSAKIMASLYSVSSAIDWFRENEAPDLIFSDVQLGDGLCFDIFKQVSLSAPVIFCTAFDEYALKAFNANGIDYILKPFDREGIEAAFNKYEKLKETFSSSTGNLEQIIRLMESQKRKSKGSVLVYRQEKIFPIRFEDIALFYIENEITHLITFDHKSYTINKTIEAVEEIAPDDFYRANRQYLVNRKAIREASQYFGRKLSLALYIPFKETITVSKTKATDFLNWLTNY